MNIFSSLKMYAGKWNEKTSRNFDKEEVEAIESAHVVDSQYGKSVCFIMKAGGMTYIPLDANSQKATGDNIDITQAKLVTLCKQGEADIYRIKA